MEINNSNQQLYNYLCFNVAKIDWKIFNILLREHELNCLSKFVKSKFPEDKRSLSDIKELIKSEYNL